MKTFEDIFAHIAEQIQWLIAHLKKIFGIEDAPAAPETPDETPEA